jgi:hypothetical protein
MVPKEVLKKEADKLMEIKGNTKGSELLTLKKYIETKYGKEEVKRLEKKMAELGYPLYFNEIKPDHWYSESLNVLAMVTAKEIFHWKNLFEFGYNSPVFSFGVKVFIKFLPLPLFLKEVPKVWRKFVDVGTLEISQFNEKEKYIIICFKDYKFHPAMCRYYEGFFLRLLEYFIKSEKITIKETKCIYKGDPYHEYVTKW